MTAASDIPSEEVREYCRTARRLRHRLRHAPTVMHLSLRSLKPATKATVAPARPTPSILDAPAAERFALLVRYSLVGTLLPYSVRQALLRKAGRMGIKRFDANLIIATVQHQAGAKFGEPASEKRSGWIWVVAIGVQLLIATGIWALMR